MHIYFHNTRILLNFIIILTIMEFAHDYHNYHYIFSNNDYYNKDFIIH